MFASELLENREEMYACIVIGLACSDILPHTDVLPVAKGLMSVFFRSGETQIKRMSI